MEILITIIKNDLRNIFRDKALYTVFVVPIIFILLINFGLPLISVFLPGISTYSKAIMAFACLITSIMPAYVLAFVTLDEKDQQIIPVLRVLPFSFGKFIGYRLFFLVALSFFFVYFMLLFTSLISVSFFNLILLALASSLISPLSYLAIILLAKNKIEGVTYFKLVNILFALPIVAFFIDSTFSKLAYILPMSWTFKAFLEPDSLTFYTDIGISIIFHLILAGFLHKKCLRHL